MDKIKQFKNEYRWLSNFAVCRIKIGDFIYNSTEAAYQSEKSDDINWKIFCRDNRAGVVKKKSREITLTNDWNMRKVNVMRIITDQKYNQTPYKEMLIATGERIIEEGNTWNDTFWGIDLITGKGDNNLGKIIMDKREELYTTK